MKGKRIISSLLSMAMVFTLNTGMSFAEEAPVTEEPVVEEQPVEEPAVVEEQPVVEEETVAPEEQQPVQEEPAVETQEEETKAEEPQYPAQTFTGTTPNGTVTVNVTADEGSLPAGTKMYVYDVNNADIEGLVDSVISGTRKSMVAVNIIFEDKDGNEIEPLTDVTITIDNTVMPEMENKSLVHINQDNEVDVVQDYEILEFKEEKVVFTTDVFSIYAIVDSGQTDDGKYRATFKFTNFDGSEFKFINDAGNEVSEQILKNGEHLQDVGLPVIDPGSKKFLGWYLYENGQYADHPVDWNEPVTVNDNKTYEIRAKFGDVHYITFYEFQEEGSSVYTKKQVNAGDNYKIADETLPAQENDLIFVGWCRKPLQGTDRTQDDREPISDTEIPVSEDIELYPVYKQAHWLNFVSAPRGAGGSFVSSQYVKYGDKIQKPEDPTRSGYTFDFWSTTPHEYTGEGSDIVITNTEEARQNEVDFRKELKEDSTYYGYWEPDEVTYTIIYWKQDVTDDKQTNINNDNNNKHFSYYSMEQRTFQALETVNLLEDAEDATKKNETDAAFKGFKYNPDKSTQSVVVKSDGSSVLNVYYDRELVTMQFFSYYTEDYWGRRTYYSPGGYDSQIWSNTEYKDYVTTYTGLYGQPLSKYNYNWPSGVWTYYSNSDTGTTYMSYLGQFVLPVGVRDSNGLLFRAYQTSRYGSHAINIYQDNGLGDYKLVSTGYTNGSPFNFTEKYDGYEVYQYQRFNDGDEVDEGLMDVSVLPVNKDKQHYITLEETHYGQVTDYYDINVYYKLKTFKVQFCDSETGLPIESISPVEHKYGTSLEDITPPKDVDSPYPGKKFSGLWYEDQACTKEFDWENEVMPNGDVKVFAKWDDIIYWVKVDPNGGELGREVGGTTHFNAKYGENISAYDFIQRNYVESPNGNYYYHYGEFDEKNPDGEQPEPVAYYDDSSEGSTGNTYREEPGAYQLIGWYNVDPSTDKVTTPYNFESGVTDNVYIRAIWRRVGEYHLKYDAGEGSGPSDGAGYADGSDAVILKAPTPPQKMIFKGWQYGDDPDKLYKPGDVIQVNAEYDALDGKEDKYITIKAVYVPYESSPVKTTHINWYSNKYDAAGYEIPGVTNQKVAEYKGVPYNEARDIVPYSKVQELTGYDDYTFLGWARVPQSATDPKPSEDDLFLKYENGEYKAIDKSSGEWVTVKQIGAIDDSTIQDLYAVWATSFKVYHSGVDGGSIEEILLTSSTKTYDLTKNLTPNTLYGGYYKNYNSTKAYNPADPDLWDYTQVYTQDGRKMHPEGGKTYYVKEVPNNYLLPYYQYTYSKGSGIINDIYLMSAIDDVNYESVGFEISGDKDAHVYTQFTLRVSNGSRSEVFTPSKMFNNENMKGFVTEAKGTDILLGDSNKNKTFYLRPYWITPDGVKISGVKKRKITTGDMTIWTFTKSDEDA